MSRHFTASTLFGPVRLLLTPALLVIACSPMITAPQPAGRQEAYTTDWLNLRAGPSTNNYIKLVMAPGEYVDLLSDLGRAGYYKVSYQGELGYAFADYLSVGGSSVDPGWDDAGSALRRLPRSICAAVPASIFGLAGHARGRGVCN